MLLNKEKLDIISHFETPSYVYDLNELKKNIKQLLSNVVNEDNFHIHYAVKANNNHNILKEISNLGLGADCVSGNEILRALECGFNSNKIVFAGVGKSDKEIEIGIEKNVHCFNCESIQEILVIDKISKQKNKVVNVAVRINPNLKVDTHKYITTGVEENKFGISFDELYKNIDKINVLKNINLIGIHYHIGSQITEFLSFEKLAELSIYHYKKLNKKNLNIKSINIGGGLGIDYLKPEQNPVPDYYNYFKIFKDKYKNYNNLEFHFELGRSIVANCGFILTKVLYTKTGNKKSFVICDSGMTEIIRPSLYDAYHKVINISNNDKTKTNCYDVVGPVCETSDFIAKNTILPITKREDKLLILSTGAYCQVMSNEYNLREKAKEFYI